MTSRASCCLRVGECLGDSAEEGPVAWRLFVATGFAIRGFGVSDREKAETGDVETTFGTGTFGVDTFAGLPFVPPESETVDELGDQEDSQ